MPDEILPHRTVQVSPFATLRPHVLYDLLRLRAEVFVVEQQCVFNDIDGRDHEPDTLHLWITEGDALVASARILDEGDGTHQISRVVVTPSRRGTDLSDVLVRTALELVPGVAVIKAQAGLAGWYATYGFEISGAMFDEDGIDHLPMRRAADVTVAGR